MLHAIKKEAHPFGCASLFLAEQEGFVTFSPAVKIMVSMRSRPASSKCPPDTCSKFFKSHLTYKK